MCSLSILSGSRTGTISCNKVFIYSTRRTPPVLTQRPYPLIVDRHFIRIKKSLVDKSFRFFRMLIDKLPYLGIAGHMSENFGLISVDKPHFPSSFYSFHTQYFKNFEKLLRNNFQLPINYPNPVDRAFECRSSNLQNVFQSPKLVCLPHY